MPQTIVGSKSSFITTRENKTYSTETCEGKVIKQGFKRETSLIEQIHLDVILLQQKFRQSLIEPSLELSS